MLQTKDPSTAWRVHKGTMGRARFQATCGQQSVEHDSFLWSLADLMTLLLVFFVMLYSNAAAQLSDGTVQAEEPGAEAATMNGDRSVGVFSDSRLTIPVLDVEAAEAQRAQPEVPVETMPVAEPSEAPQADESTNGQMLADLADSSNKDFYLRWEDRQPVIVLGERITFNAGQAILLVEAQDALRRVARLISNIGDCQVVVTGHTDDRPIHTKSFPSNWELSAARAASVAKALMDSGVSPDRMIIQGQSQFKPLLTNTTDDNRRVNRRVEISLISD